jgi:GNAT superfamily N-acetyltransferase
MEPDRGGAALRAAAFGEGWVMRGWDDPALREIGEAEIALCYPLMRQLRPHLASADEFAERWRRQSAVGYRIVALWSEQGPSALAGFRINESLIHGRFLYVDDLVAAERERSRGYGARLMAFLKNEGRTLGCAKLVLDTGLDNVLGHRFYDRQGLVAMALRFGAPLIDAR